MLVAAKPQEAVNAFFSGQSKEIHDQKKVFQIKTENTQMHRWYHQMHKIPFFRVFGEQPVFVLPVEGSARNGCKYRNSRIGKIHSVDEPAQIPEIFPPEADICNK